MNTSTDSAPAQGSRPLDGLGWLPLAYLLFVALFSLWVCYDSYLGRISVPIIDDWRILDEFYSMSLLEWMFSNQNGHRTAFTFGLFALDYVIFDGQQEMLVIAMQVTAWLSVGILYLAYVREQPTPIAKMAFGFAWFATFWAGGSYNFFWGVCQGNLMVAVWLFVALACLVSYAHPQPREHRRGYLPVCAGLAALCACYSLGEGLGAWPALIAVAIVARLPLRVVILLTLGFVSTIAVYTAGLETTGKFSFSASTGVLFRPADFLEFVASFLGALPARTGQGLGLVDAAAVHQTSTVLGGIGLGVYSIYAVWLLRRASSVGRAGLVAFGILTFSVAAAAVVALGRIPRAPITDAVAERFVNWSALFWMGGVLAVPPLVRGRATVVAAVLITVGSVCMLPAVTQIRAGFLDFAGGASKASLGVLLGIRAPELAARMGAFVGLPLVTNDHDLVQKTSRRSREERFHRVSDRLKSDRRGFFAHPWSELPGTRVSPRFAVVPPDRCRGAMATPIPLTGTETPAARIVGWAREGENGVPPLVFVSDKTGIIRGLATPEPQPASAMGGSGQFGWAGYLNGFDPSKPYLVYALFADGRSACRFGSTNVR